MLVSPNRCMQNGHISNLSQSLHNNHRNKAENMVAINNIEDQIIRNKLLLLHSAGNIEPTERAKRAAERVTVEAVEFAVMAHQDRHDEDMELFDNENMCISMAKNGMNVLTANEVKRDLKEDVADLREELSNVKSKETELESELLTLKSELLALKSNMDAKDMALKTALQSDMDSKDKAINTQVQYDMFSTMTALKNELLSDIDSKDRALQTELQNNMDKKDTAIKSQLQDAMVTMYEVLKPELLQNIAPVGNNQGCWHGNLSYMCNVGNGVYRQMIINLCQ